MTPDELWEKHTACGAESGYMIYEEFLAALKEYGEHVKSEAVKVCREVATERMTAPTKGFCITNDGLGCAAAIEKMELP